MKAKIIYFAQRADGSGPIKIGCSSHVAGRLRQLSSDYRANFVVLARGVGSYLTERNIHLKFTAHRADIDCDVAGHSEWFNPVPELLAFIDVVRSTGTIPLEKTDCRELVFAERYLAGETLKQIGDEFGITRERVRQVLRHIGVESLGHRAIHAPKPHDLSANEIAAARAYGRGELTKDICARYDIARHQLLAACRRLGVPIKKPGRPFDCDPSFVAAQVAALYQRGISTEEIARKFGWAHRTYIYRWLDKAGVPRLTNKGRPVRKKAA